MNCLELERLLDEGAPDALPAAAAAHAETCPRCARALAIARTLEGALERQFAGEPKAHEAVPAGFTDRVLARVQAVEARGVRWLALPPELSWWVRVPAEPAVVLAVAVAALLLWRGDQLLAAVRAWAPSATLATVRLPELVHAAGLGPLVHALQVAFVPAPGAHWTLETAMAIGVAPLLILVGLGLWRLGERVAGPPGAALVWPHAAVGQAVARTHR